jgi:predicted HTH domain antitoxin
MTMDDYNDLPDVRDGLTRKERIILYCIDEIQKELGGRNVPTVMLYGRVVEYVDISVDELQLILQKLIGDNSYSREQ